MRAYVISISPSHAPGSFTTSPTTCAPGTIFSTHATLFKHFNSLKLK